MAMDVFGDPSLFEEFEKERLPSSSYIKKDHSTIDENDDEKHFVFKQEDFESDSESSSNDTDLELDEVQQQHHKPRDDRGENNKSNTGKSVDNYWIHNNGGVQDQRSHENGQLSKTGEGRESLLKLTKDCILSKFQWGRQMTSHMLWKCKHCRQHGQFGKENFSVVVFRAKAATDFVEKCKRFSKLLDASRHVPVDEGPALQVLYKNNVIARKYRPQIEQYINGLIQQDKASRDRKRLQDLRLKASALSTVELNADLSKEDSLNMDAWSKNVIIGCSQIYEDFVLDTLGWPLVEHTPALTDGWEIPSFSDGEDDDDTCVTGCDWSFFGDIYEQVFPKVMPCESDDENEGPKRNSRPKACCFNCGESHMLSECPEPKDQNRIRENRRLFKQESGSPASLKSLGSQKHLNIEDDPRFSGFKPGQVSDELRSALGLERHQLPTFIYKMRVLGYPPGWMQEMEESKSGISMFDKHGKEVSLTGESLEDGEMNSEENPVTMDPDKIIEYEGFTVPPSDGRVDEHQYLGFPPMQPHQMKKNIATFLSNQARFQKEASKGGKRQHPSTDDDMDLDSDYAATPAKRLSQSSYMSPPPLPLDTPPSNPPLPEGTPPPTPPVAQGRALSFDNPRRHSVDGRRESMDRSGANTPSESLEDLEGQYKVLMEQLAAEEGGLESDMIVVDSYDSTNETPEEGELSQDSQDSDHTQVLSPVAETSLEIKEIPSNGTNTTEITEISETLLTKGSVSLSRNYGTPISSGSAKSILPDPDKFGTGVQDHIPFENLPDATGRFQKLKGLLGKIRDTVSSKKKKKGKS